MEEKFIYISGNQYRYIERQGNGAKLLFLHGLSDFSDQILPMANFLPGDWHILALDQRGHGGSWQPDNGYSPVEYARDVRIFIEKLNFAPVNLLGHSMGGRNALVCTAKYPELTNSLILGDIGPDGCRADIQETTHFFNGLPKSFTSEDKAFAHLKSRKPGYNNKQITLLMKNLIKDHIGLLRWRYSRDACIQSVQKARSRGWWQYYKKVSCKTLLLHVVGSTELSDKTAHKMRNDLKNITYERISNCGHNFHIEKPKEGAKIIIKFISSM